MIKFINNAYFLGGEWEYNEFNYFVELETWIKNIPVLLKNKE